jgi:hypothetical protein
MDQQRVRSGEGEWRVLERGISRIPRGCGRATAVLAGGGRGVARGREGVSGRVYTDASDRWYWLQGLGQWTSGGGVGSDGRMENVGSSPVKGLGTREIKTESKLTS